MKIFKNLLFLCLAISFDSVAQTDEDLTKYVNPFIGTGGHGHTYPGATLPFGMVQLSPDTDNKGWDWCSGYHYSDSSVMGFSHTHLSGTGMGDYGDILLMPVTGEPKFVPGSKDNPDEGYRSRFSHDNEIAEAGYYSVLLEDYDIKVELTTTERVGFHKYTFPKEKEGYVILDLKHGIHDVVLNSKFGFIDKNKIIGFRESNGVARHTVYFAIEFSRPFKEFGTVIDDKIYKSKEDAEGKNVKGYVKFDTSEDNEVLIKVAISHVNTNGAVANLLEEIKGWDFEKVRNDAKAEWNKKLHKIEVEGGTEDQKTIFYTALYHAMICPNIFNDVNGNYLGMDKKKYNIQGQNTYTVFSLWDTYRSTHPLYTIIEPTLANDFVETLLHKYQESGMLPVWELAGHETNVMIGNHSISVIADAFMKGLKDYDLELAYEAMKHSAMMDNEGLKYYKAQGHIPANLESESVSRLLEYAYNDWCVAQVAKSLRYQDDYEYFIGRSKYYINVFDKSTGFMRARYNGDWIKDFDPFEVSRVYTEANAWHYTFYVPHDVAGMIDLYGGNEKFVNKLDEMFSASSELGGHHQPDVTGLIGQYAHGNEPSHHAAYLYNYADAPWKTQKHIRNIINTMYKNTPDGLSGNEDCGQMSSWLVMSAMGFYPVCPGDNQYVIGSPLFDKVTINLENGKKFIITANNNSAENFYIQSASLNGKNYKKSYITHSDIMNGGTLVFNMSYEPSKSWGVGEENRPFSRVDYNSLPIPVVESDVEFFKKEMSIKLTSVIDGAKIYYTLDGSEPTESSSLYKEPILLNGTTTVKTFASKKGHHNSPVIEAKFFKYNNHYEVKLNSEYSKRYSGGGPKAIVNEARGSDNFLTSPWQGYEGVDLDAEIDLGSKKKIESLYGSFLQNINAWIFLPAEVEFFISNDGSNWNSIATVKNEFPQDHEGAVVKEIGKEFKNIETRYIRVKAKNIKKCPEWHKGAGGKAWVFVDEIIINTEN